VGLDRCRDNILSFRQSTALPSGGGDDTRIALDRKDFAFGRYLLGRID
jgi:hypothetical protein